MLKSILRGRIAAFERRYGYDASYMRDVLAASTDAFFRLRGLTRISGFRGRENSRISSRPPGLSSR